MPKIYGDQSSGLSNATLVGSNGADVFEIYHADTLARGRSGNDQFTLSGSPRIPLDVTLDGGNGDDLFILNGGGSALVLGGSGKDSFISRSFGETLDGGRGDDRFDVSSGGGHVLGGDGNDQVTLEGLSIVAEGGKGVDLFVLRGLQHSTISGGTGNDVISVDSSRSSFIAFVELNLDDGNDIVTIRSNQVVDVTINGGKGADRIDVFARSMTFRGETGNDSIYSGGDGNQLWGGDGDDLLLVSSGSGGRVMGERGNDVVSVGGFGDMRSWVIDGGSGDDSISVYGKLTASWVEGGDGNDIFTLADNNSNRFSGGAGNDDFRLVGHVYFYSTFMGGSGDDRYVGRDVSGAMISEESGRNVYDLSGRGLHIATGRDLDAVTLGGDANTVDSGSAGQGITEVIAAGGSLTFIADGAHDRLVGRLETSTVRFGAGFHEIADTGSRDSFIFTDSQGLGAVTIGGYHRGQDSLDVRALHLTAAELNDAIAHAGHSLALIGDNGTAYYLTLTGVDLHSLSASDFLIA